MARYVVIEFVDNVDAELFIQQLNDDNADRRQFREPFMRRVVGVFVKPGKTCTCEGKQRGNFGVKNFHFNIAEGEKFGWWVCTQCNKPRTGGHQLRNQLDMNNTYEGFIYDGYEFTIPSLDITSIFHTHIKRPKRLRRKKAK